MPVPDRDFRPRRVRFDVSPSVPRHYIAGDLVQSHLVTLGSAVFPEGEDFFVRSVRHYRDRIDDPELARQVAAFIGQEAMHGREHRSLNERFAAMGYPTRFVDRAARHGLWFVERFLPHDVQLAITAALEHYTATLAEVLLTNPDAQAAHTDDEIRRLFLWHALEESEHKAVAFDVFRSVSGNERVRIRVIRVLTAEMAVVTTIGLLISLATDRDTWRPRTLLQSVRALPGTPFVNATVLERLKAYNRAGFHPDDVDSSALVARWREELFAETAA